MARAVLLALACAGTLAAGARYGDYSGAIMPQYGGDYDARAAPPADDYRDHSPDASAHLDYKYEEVSSGKIDKPISPEAEEDNSWNKPVKKPRHEKSIDDIEHGALNNYKLDKIDKPTSTYTEEDDSWNKPVKKLRNENSIDDVEPGALNKYKLDEGPKFQSKYRGNNMARHRNKNIFRTEEAWSRRMSPGRDDQQILRADEEENQLRLQGVRDDSLENEHEIGNFGRRETKPKVRRKARDRPNINTLLKLDNDDEESLSYIRDVQKPLKGGQAYREDEESTPAPTGRLAGRAGAPDGEDDDDFVASPPPGRKHKPANKFNENADYYQMQRLQSIKKKSPALSNAWRTTPPVPRRVKATRRMLAQPNGDRDPFGGAPLVPATRTTSDPFGGAPLEPTDGTTSSSFDTGPPLEPATEAISEPVTVTPLTPPTRTSHHTTIKFSVTRELSIAEKSRLSILKKALRKESSQVNGTTTYKPPVLLQVTNKLQTMVMVERPLNQDLWKRAREVSDDTPERLKKVKNFMRRKLVANANDIRNLTDNWDDIVCDYVDIAMLDAKATSLKANILLLINLLVVYLTYL